jgi:hypothetical protein
MAIGARVDGPQCPTGWQWHGAAGTAEAHQSFALHSNGAPFFGGLSSYGTGGVRGTHQSVLLLAGGTRAGCGAARFMLQHSAMVGGHSNGRLTTRMGKTGAAQDLEHRCWVDGA